MKENTERARRLVPTIILTVLSMIQAIALELFWNKITESEQLWQGGLTSVVTSLQFATVFFGILMIWLLYVSFVLRFNWLPSLEDTLVPFFIGLLEFALIDLTQPALVGPWLLLLACVFSVSVIASNTIFSRARADPSNAYFFNQYEPRSWRDYRESTITVVTIGTLGVILWLSPQMHWLACVSLLVALAALGYQYIQVRRFWLHSFNIDDQASAPDPGLFPSEKK